MLFKSMYALPAMAGHGEHWYLHEKEAATLAEQGEAALGAMPVAKVQAITKFVAAWGPVVGFITAAVVITQDRIVETRRLNDAARADEGSTTRQQAPQGNGAANGASAGKGGPPGTVAGRRADLFQQGQ